LDLKKVWVTWSFWKSSVKEFLSQILSEKYNVLKTPKNKNTPLWISNTIIDKIGDSYDYFICEMWAYKKWEIEELWEIVDHKYAFLTWINNQHISLFWSQKNIIEWKSEIMKKVLKNNWIVYVNFDTEFARMIDFPEWLNYVTYWLNNPRVDAISIIENINSSWILFKFKYRNEIYEFEVSVLWKHNISNLTWVIAFCMDQWMTKREIQSALNKVEPSAWNLKLIKKTDDLTLIDDTYNSNVTWIASACEILEFFEKSNRILVLDDVLELWEDSDKFHYLLGKEIWKKNIQEISLIWKEFPDFIEKWLLEVWFKWEIYRDFSYENLERTVILFEWREAKKYLDKLNDDV